MAKIAGDALIDRLMRNVGRIQVLTTDTNYRALALTWINDVLKDISSRQSHWRWLEKTATFDTVANQHLYTAPSDLSGHSIIDVKQVTTPVKLRFVEQRWLDRMQPQPTDSTGDPFVYTYNAGSIKLWPVPSSAIEMTIRYIKNITALTDSSGSTTDIPEEFETVVLDGAKVPAFMFEPAWGNAVAQRQIYELGIGRMIEDNAQFIDDAQVSDSHAFGDFTEGIKPPFSFNPTGDFS